MLSWRQLTRALSVLPQQSSQVPAGPGAGAGGLNHPPGQLSSALAQALVGA